MLHLLTKFQINQEMKQLKILKITKKNDNTPNFNLYTEANNKPKEAKAWEIINKQNKLIDNNIEQNDNNNNKTNPSLIIENTEEDVEGKEKEENKTISEPQKKKEKKKI